MSKSREGSDMEEGLSSTGHVAQPVPARIAIPSTSKPDSKRLAVAAGDLLECTICLEVPASPIHTCANGHVICGICVDKLRKCGLCQNDSFHVSTLAERISRQMDFKASCPNSGAGCPLVIASTEIKEHIPKCYYRDVECKERSVEGCKDVSIPLKDYPRHLKDKHKCTQGWSVTRSLESLNNMLPEGYTWPMVITIKDGKSFLMHNYIGKDVIYFWMTVLADKQVADKYMYKLALRKKLIMATEKRMEVCWTLPVLPYHDYSEFNEFEDPSSLCITIPATFLFGFTEKEGIEGTTWPAWRHTFKMSHLVI